MDPEYAQPSFSVVVHSRASGVTTRKVSSLNWSCCIALGGVWVVDRVLRSAQRKPFTLRQKIPISYIQNARFAQVSGLASLPVIREPENTQATNYQLLS